MVKPDYQLAIEAKCKSLGWTEAADNGGTPIQTFAKKGWVQYYGAKNRAIYYFNGTAYSALKNEMDKYDATGQDNFSIITADYQTTNKGGGYIGIKLVADNAYTGNSFPEGIIITSPGIGVFLVYGTIYKEYLRLGRWNSPLGFPINEVVNTPNTIRDKGYYEGFQNGTIWHSAFFNVGGALWGKALKMFVAVDYERGWLGYPVESCNPNLTDNQKQSIGFEKGHILLNDRTTGCGSYANYLKTSYANVQGKLVSNEPCY